MTRTFRIFINILLSILSIFFWVVFPPIFLLIPKPIKKFWVRLILCFASPLCICLVVEGYLYLERKYRYSQDELECIVGVELPEYNVVKYTEKEINTHMIIGYKMKKILLFNDLPTQVFYDKLDSLCCLNKNLWTNEVYLSEDSIKLKNDNLVKGEFDKSGIHSIVYYFYGNVKLRIEKGSRLMILEYSDIDFRI